MMKKAYLFLFLLIYTLSSSQRTCGTPNKMNNFFREHPEMVSYSKELRKFLETPSNVRKRTIGTVITVPVVVHVLYKNSTQNISDAQILSQIAVLNDDFRKANSDFSTVVPAVFQTYGADLQIAFCMATKDPNGLATNGIVRKSIDSSFDFDNDYYKPTGDLAWDTTKYLNVWVGSFTDNTLLGFAYLPDAAGLPYDGLCIEYKYFGTTGTAAFPFNKGRTATHEIGHYFGLNHPWGEDGSTCGAANNDDGVADTPGTNNPYYGSPTFPDSSKVCDVITYPNGAMFMNYMDYVNDANMAFFTAGQKVITSNTLVGPRASLYNSNGCASMSTSEIDKIDKIKIYPNPSSQYISVSSPLVNVDEIEVFDNSGRLVLSKTNILPQEKIDIKNLAVGIYYIRIYSKGSLLKSEKIIKQ